MSNNLQDFTPQQLIEDPLSVEQVAQTGEQPINSFPYYIDAYNHPSLETSRVLRFGINTHREELRGELGEYNLQQRQSLSGILEKMSNISGDSNYGKFVDSITPTNIEMEVVNNAIQHLMDTDNKTVLIDLFPRVLKKAMNKEVGNIDLTQDVETHTALLYKTTTNILVIDPNNPQFSAFLKNVNPDIIQSSYRANDKIYERVGDAGPNSWRDCIDIAVKLAFVLNNSQTQYHNTQSIIKSPEVKQITNNNEIDETIFYSKNNLVREKQKSDILFSYEFYSRTLELSNKYNEEKAKKDQEYLVAMETLKVTHETEINELEMQFLGELGVEEIV